MEIYRYRVIADHYKARLSEHGDTAKGADWPNQEDRETRFAVMLDLLSADHSQRIDLLDFACGTGDMLRYIRSLPLPQIHYHGADYSTECIELAKTKFPGRFVLIRLISCSRPTISLMHWGRTIAS